MIEVRNTAPAPLQAAVQASSKGAVEARDTGGKKLPEPTENQIKNSADEVPKAPEKSEPKLESVVASINDYVQSIQRNLQFSVDEELDKTVIKVVDGGSGELIRQIPEEVFLELARNLKEDGELRLVNTLG
ncbi:flagellar protein FlaG [Teredinibacter franksiae]|uniref:flagellar protein FlaG n=1 Tax=Teredinibacter franksiae TaxID=2761453 RepID=UPI001628FB48|nr:flagellar protein FlaG [Teredinibacter franksiae]